MGEKDRTQENVLIREDVRTHEDGHTQEDDRTQEDGRIPGGDRTQEDGRTAETSNATDATRWDTLAGTVPPTNVRTCAASAINAGTRVTRCATAGSRTSS